MDPTNLRAKSVTSRDDKQPETETTEWWHPFTAGAASPALCCFCGKTAAEHVGAVVAAMEAVLTGMGWERDDAGLWAEDGNGCHTWGTHDAFRSTASRAEVAR